MTTTTSTSRRSSSDAPFARVPDEPRSLTIPRRSGPTVHLRWSVRGDGDFHRTEVPLVELEPRRRHLVDLPWTMLDEHHGVDVVRVDRPGASDGARGDIALTALTGAVLGCWVGDCAPVVLVGRDRTVATVHAGWRGLAAGVVDVALDALDEPAVAAVLGPCIGACCYEFGASDLDAVAVAAGVAPDRITGRTRLGARSLDVTATVASVLERRRVPLTVVGGCTGCTYDGFSHRVRADRHRHVVAAWQTDGAA